MRIKANMRAKKLAVFFRMVDNVGDRFRVDECLPIIANLGKIRSDNLCFECMPSATAFMLNFI